MTSVVITCLKNDSEHILALAAFADLAGIQEEDEDGRLRFWLRDERDAVALARRLAAWHPVIERVEDRNWNEEWQRGWKPMEIGQRFYLVPPGDDSPAPPGRLRLEMHQGSAFGNGDHATTHLCLMAMERHLRPGDFFLDIGCGSGLLSEAARALGARCATGCDLDRSGVRPGSFIGSLPAVRTASCDFAAANIQLGVLIQLMPEIARVLRPGGRCVLSGVFGDQVGNLCEAAAASGLVPGQTNTLQGWASVLTELADRLR